MTPDPTCWHDLTWVRALLDMPSFVASGAAFRNAVAATKTCSAMPARGSPKFLRALLLRPAVRAVMKRQSATTRGAQLASNNIAVAGRRQQSMARLLDTDADRSKSLARNGNVVPRGKPEGGAPCRHRRRKAKRLRRAFRHVDYLSCEDNGQRHAPFPMLRCRPRRLPLGKLAKKAQEVSVLMLPRYQ